MNDGGSAFPMGYEGETTIVTQEGMTLRDYFAGQALAGWLATFGPSEEAESAHIAVFSYRVADAMLAKREIEG